MMNGQPVDTPYVFTVSAYVTITVMFPVDDDDDTTIYVVVIAAAAVVAILAALILMQTRKS